MPGTRSLIGTLLVAGIVAGCSSSESTSDSTSITDSAPDDTTPAATSPPPPDADVTTTTTTVAADNATVDAIVMQLASSPPGCDPLDTRACVLPFPSDALTVDDDTSATTRRVAFPEQGLPTNSSGVAIDPAAWNLADGFSANSPILTWVAGLDPAASNLPSWIDLQASLERDTPVVLVDTATGDRVPLWAEVDVAASGPDGQLLVIHPAVSLDAATTYAVGVRGLVTTEGAPVAPTPAFRVLRDGLGTDLGVIEDRRDAMTEAIDALERGGVPPAELQLAWSFTTSSIENTTADILRMRDETLDGLGDSTPEFEITTVTESPEPGLARLVEGTYSVPNWMTLGGGPGTELNRSDDGRPEINGVLQAPFACGIADAVVDAAVDGGAPANAVVYGHGLLGSHLEVTAGNIVAMSNEHNAIYCATKWAGFSDDDIPTAVASLEDLSNFPEFIDRMSQGLVNQLVLGRLVLADNGLVGEPAFLRDDGSTMLDNTTLSYDGNSQGGIMGMALAAISTDVERFALGVVGMNYSTLLPRSVDFVPFEPIFVAAYPDAIDRAIALGVVQMLWDRTEGAGYVRHIVDNPLPGTPAKQVLMHVAFGDWQVSELTALVAARTMGVPIHRPVTADGRSREISPGWGLDAVDYARDTSALVVWDSGSDPIPLEAVPPSTSRDPHGDPRDDVEVRRQKAAFLFDGELIEICNAGPCTTLAR
jgi:hypothetical protein